MDILWAIANPLTAPTPPPKPPRLSHRSSTSFGLNHYDDILPSTSSISNLSGAALLSMATSQNFALPTPPYADGSWEMYQDFVGGVQFWGYALASASGDGGVRMWDSESQAPIQFRKAADIRVVRTGQAHRTLTGHNGPVTCLQFDENSIVTGSLDKTIRVSNRVPGRRISC